MAKIPATRRFSIAAEDCGFAPTVVVFSEDTRTAEQAALALGCNVEQIVKSLIFMVKGEPVLVLTSGVNTVDVDVLETYLGSRPERASAEQVRAATGFAIGGVPPFGHSTPLRTLIDSHLVTLELVWAAAGSPKSVFQISSAELIAITGATAWT